MKIEMRVRNSIDMIMLAGIAIVSWELIRGTEPLSGITKFYLIGLLNGKRER